MRLLGSHRTLELAVLRLWAAGYSMVATLRTRERVWHNPAAHQVGLPTVVRARVTGGAWPYRTTVEPALDVQETDLPAMEKDEAA